MVATGVFMAGPTLDPLRAVVRQGMDKPGRHARLLRPLTMQTTCKKRDLAVWLVCVMWGARGKAPPALPIPSVLEGSNVLRSVFFTFGGCSGPWNAPFLH